MLVTCPSATSSTTQSSTQTATRTSSNAPSQSATPTQTPSQTATQTSTSTPSQSPTLTQSVSQTPTPTRLDVITCGSTYTSSNVLAGDQFGFGPGQDVAYSLTLTATTSIQLSTCFDATDYDTIVAIFDVKSKVFVAMNDNAPDESCVFKSTISTSLDAVSGLIYPTHFLFSRPLQGSYIVVVDSAETSSGNFQVSMTCPISCGGIALGSNDMKFSLVLDSSTIVQVSTCSESTTYDTVVAVVDLLNQVVVASNDDDSECTETFASTVLVDLVAVSFWFISQWRRN